MISKNLVFTPVTTHGSQAGMKKDLKFIPGLPEGLSSAGHSLRGKARFTPIWAKNNTSPDIHFTSSTEALYDREKQFKDGFTLDWWTPSAIYNYGALMVSAAYGMSEWNFREYYNIPRNDDFLFITDSGGYQIFSQGLKLEPVEILHWMENNADVGLALDRPPLKSGRIPIFGKPDEIPRASENDFKISIEKSRENYEIMARNRQSDKLKLLKVIHGYSLRELNQFYNAVKDINFDGHAFGANQDDVRSVALVLGFAQTIEKERIHMFLITGEYTAPVIIYGKRFFNHLTFDSSSFSQTGARYRKYYYPGDISAGISFGNSYTAKLKSLPCTCPVCQLATVDDLNQEGSVPGGLIALHNLYQVLEYFYTLEQLSDSPDHFIDYLKLRGCPNKTLQAIEYLRCIEENDFEYANKKFKMESVGTTDLEGFFS